MVVRFRGGPPGKDGLAADAYFCDAWGRQRRMTGVAPHAADRAHTHRGRGLRRARKRSDSADRLAACTAAGATADVGGAANRPVDRPPAESPLAPAPSPPRPMAVPDPPSRRGRSLPPLISRRRSASRRRWTKRIWSSRTPSRHRAFGIRVAPAIFAPGTAVIASISGAVGGRAGAASIRDTDEALRRLPAPLQAAADGGRREFDR